MLDLSSLIPWFTAIHVLVVILWIGGVAFVTINLFPILIRMEDSLEKVLIFQAVESRFARQARIYIFLTGITGVVLLFLKNGWGSLFTKSGLGILIMILTWLVYLFILTFEKRIFKVLFSQREEDPSKIFKKLNILHWIILILSLFAVFTGLYFGHGGS